MRDDGLINSTAFRSKGPVDYLPSRWLLAGHMGTLGQPQTAKA